MLGVLLVHTTATSAVELSPASSLYPIYILVNRFGKIGTTTFVFLSSLVLFYNYGQRTIDGGMLGRFFRRRVALVLLPYLVWSGFYYMLGLTQLYGWAGARAAATAGGLGRALLYGDAYYHLYFVVINVQFYLLFPLFLWLVQSHSRRRPGSGWQLIALGITMQWAFWWYARSVSPVAYKSSIALTYFSHYWLGAFAGLYYDRFVAFLERPLGRAGRASHIVAALWAAAGLGYSVLYYRHFGFGTVHAPVLYELAWSAYTYLSLLMLVCVGRALCRRAGPRLLAAMSGFGAVTFGIYLVHPVLLMLWETHIIPRAGGAPPTYHLAVAGGFALVTLGSWLLATLVHRLLPGSWALLGPPLPSAAGQAGAAPRGSFSRSGQLNPGSR